jgi:O-antigen/teichoic acid export membrane protein
MRNTLRSWWQDKLLRGVLKNTGYLFSSNTISAALSMVNSIFATRLLGVDGLGLITTIQTFTSNINRLLSFRMSEVVVKHLGQALAGTQANPGTAARSPEVTIQPQAAHRQAAGIVKGIGLIEAATSTLAYLILVLLAPWAAQVLLKDPSLAKLIPVYGLMLLANMVYETSVGVLQTYKRFNWLGVINTLQSAITALLILLVFIFKGNLLDVLAAYLLGKSFAGISITILALRQMSNGLGASWWHTSVKEAGNWRAILGFAINTNLNGTVNLITRDNAPLYLAALSPADVSQSYVGYFKLGLSIINFITLPIDPFIWPTYAEITRTIAQRQWLATRRLLRRVSSIAGLWTLAAGAFITLFGWWLIPLIYGPSTSPVYPVVLILLVGYATANILHWNRPLLLALGKPTYPLLVAVGIGAVELLLVLLLVPGGGYLAMAAILSAYLAVSVGIIAWRGWRLMCEYEVLHPTPVEAEQEDAVQ